MPKHRAQVTCSLALGLSETLKKSLATKLGDSTIPTMTDDQLKSFLNPTPEDYVLLPFRALSAASDVQHNSFNFAHLDGKALREAVDLFNGLIVLKDHDMSVDNWVGQTQDAFWDDTTAGAPPGVNFMLKIDTKADPKLARGLISGMVTSGSVTIEFDYDKSHPKMKDFEFLYALGETVDGKLVQALVTKITRCYEYSVVWQGADTNAKAIKDGSISKPGLETKTPEGTVKKLATLLKLAETATEDELATALQTSLTTLATTEAEKIAAEASVTTLTASVTAKDAELTTKSTEVTNLTAQVTTLTATSAAKDTEIAALKGDRDQFVKVLSARRAEALRLYKLAEGDKALPAMETTITNSPLEVTESFITSFGAQVEKAMPLHCTKCQSTDVTRRASSQSATEPEAKPTADAVRLKAAVSSIHTC